MANVTFIIPDSQVGRLSNAQMLDLFCQKYNYQAVIPDPLNPGQFIPNPQTKVQFWKQKTIEFWINTAQSAQADTLHAAVTTTPGPDIT